MRKSKPASRRSLCAPQNRAAGDAKKQGPLARASSCRGSKTVDYFLAASSTLAAPSFTAPAALAAALAAYPLAWLAGVALGDPSFREGGLYLTAALFAGAAAAGLLGSGRPRKKRRDPRASIRKPARRK